MNEMLKRAAAGADRLRANVTGALSRLKQKPDLIRQLGYYAALTLLLTLLGSASYAYRVRREAMVAAPEPTPRAAIAVKLPESTPEPEPTPEPERWTWPLEGEVIGDFSPEEPVWSRTLEQWQTHPGLDIAGSPGEAVYACGDGTVLDAWSDRLWGNVIVLQHGDGFQSTYAGLNTLKLVAVGDAVTAGQVISAVGDSAACEAELPWHLHFELARDGAPVDFQALMAEHTGAQE